MVTNLALRWRASAAWDARVEEDFSMKSSKALTIKIKGYRKKGMRPYKLYVHIPLVEVVFLIYFSNLLPEGDLASYVAALF